MGGRWPRRLSDQRRLTRQIKFNFHSKRHLARQISVTFTAVCILKSSDPLSPSPHNSIDVKLLVNSATTVVGWKHFCHLPNRKTSNFFRRIFSLTFAAITHHLNRDEAEKVSFRPLVAIRKSRIAGMSTGSRFFIIPDEISSQLVTR